MNQTTTKKHARRAALAAVLAAVLAVAAFYGAPVIWVEFEDTAVPSVSQARLPSGLTLIDQGRGCGSGGCYAQFVVDVENSTQHAVAELEHSAGGCRVISPFDLRRVCVDVQNRQTETWVYVSYKRIL